MIRIGRFVPALALLIAYASSAGAQTTTYHLHGSSSGDFCCRALSTAGPAPTATALQSGDLKNQTGAAMLWAFQTASGGTGLGGTIAGGSTITFSLWMKKTANWGVIMPQASLQLNGTTAVCSATGTTALSTSPASPLTFSCTVGSGIRESTTDLLRVWVGYSISTSPGNHSVKVELDVDGSTDSTAAIPNPVPPHINTATPSSAPGNWSVVFAGTNFGASQGSSTVQFNSTAATTVTAWSDTSITAAVPTGLTPGAGSVTVMVGGAASNSLPFTVIGPPSIAGAAPNPAHIGDAVTISGSNFLATQGTSTVTFNGVAATTTAWADTSITASIPTGGASGPLVVHVSGQDSNAVAFDVIVPGSFTGTITRASDGSALSGATVQAVFQGATKGSATTPANGSYTISNLDPGTYDLRVYATGYSSEVRSVAITANTSTTVNVSMFQPGAVGGQVTQADGITPLAGAAVTVYDGPTRAGSAMTDSNGNYLISSLHPATYTVQAADVGYRTKEQGTSVTENSTTTANLSLDIAPSGPVSYAYDPLGRLIQVTDASGDSAIYRYDAVGNITAIERPTATAVSISGFAPSTGPVGATVTINGTGFSATPSQDSVLFNGTAATITSATPTQLVATVPSGATSGVIGVSAPGGSASTSPATFTVVTSGGPPTVMGFSPTLLAAGDAITVNGTNFDSDPANDRLTANVAAAQVGSATSTSLQATVPTTTTGHVSITTPAGTATSIDYLWVAPPPYTVASVDATGTVSLGVPSSTTVSTASKIAMRAFEGSQGHRASASLTGVTFPAGGTLAIYGVFGDEHLTGFATSGFLEPIDLTATGTYTALVAPNSGTGSATLTVFDVPADVSAPIVAGGSSVPVSLTGPGQNARLAFSGTAGHRVSAALSSTTIASGSLKVLNTDGTALKAITFISTNPNFLDTVALPTTGMYTVFVDPDTTNTGTTTVALYDVPADTTGTTAINGSAAPVSLGTPGQNGSLTFTGSQNQQVTVHVTGSTFSSVTVRLLSSDGQTVLSQALIGGSTFNLAPATLPTPGTATYTVTIDPSSSATGTLNISVTGS